MRLLLDTHLLIWAAKDSPRLSQAARGLIRAPGNERLFSVCSLWEIATKAALGRDDFAVDATSLRNGLLASGYQEIAVLGPHVLFAARLRPIHRDPFDRLLVAQSIVEGLTLLTGDSVVASYSASIVRV